MVVPALGSSVTAVPRAGSALTGMAACMANDVRRPVSGRRIHRAGRSLAFSSAALRPPKRETTLGPPRGRPGCVLRGFPLWRVRVTICLTICARHDESPQRTSGMYIQYDLVKNQLPESYS